MSFWYPVIQYGFDNQLPGYTVEGCRVFVQVGYITADEYKQITGIDYEASA
ncbi:XkdX family protein [Paenibacillus senegalensis]|uniref:XkdX family protein n=1 Tax=Paenibacillus senegalensis TaxID=1465766 RepID=UPI000287F2C9|nr:XkdX family protein [Paenibacillus senegalensis]